MDFIYIKVVDFLDICIDLLVKVVWCIFREQYDFLVANGGHFGILVVFSDEELIVLIDLFYDKGEGFKCVCLQG